MIEKRQKRKLTNVKAKIQVYFAFTVLYNEIIKRIGDGYVKKE